MKKEEVRDTGKKKKGRIFAGIVLSLALCLAAGCGILASLIRYQMDASSDYGIEEASFEESLDVDRNGYIMGDELDTYIQSAQTLTKTEEKVAVLKDEPSFYRPRLIVRAKVEYRTNGQLKGLDDSMLLFDNAKWKKSDDGWYYYETRVDPGTKLQFFKGVKLPCDWDNVTADKNFDIIVTAQASEAFDGGKGDDQQAYVFTDSILTNVQTMEKNNDVLDIVEYQDDGKGNLTPYENHKTVTPCELVSKIVVIDIKRFVVEESRTYLEYEKVLKENPLYNVLEPLTPMANLLVPVADPLTPVAKVMGDAPVMLWYVIGGCLLSAYAVMCVISAVSRRRKKRDRQD